MLLIFQFFQAVGFYGFGSLTPIILVAKGFSVVNTLAYTAPIALGYPLGSLLSVPIVERMERKWLIVATAQRARREQKSLSVPCLTFNSHPWVSKKCRCSLLVRYAHLFSSGQAGNLKAVKPPSMTRADPVANLASGEARYRIAPAISSAVPSHPTGCRATILRRASSGSA